MRVGLSWGLIGGRWLSLSATLLALLTGLLVWLERHSLLASALGGLLYLTFTPVIIWASFYKQDMLAVALALAGLCWLARWPAGWRVYELPSFILAVYTKQTALVAPVAAIGYLCWREWRAGLPVWRSPAVSHTRPWYSLSTADGRWVSTPCCAL